jgi:hypothetical protein
VGSLLAGALALHGASSDGIEQADAIHSAFCSGRAASRPLSHFFTLLLARA